MRYYFSFIFFLSSVFSLTPLWATSDLRCSDSFNSNKGEERQNILSNPHYICKLKIEPLPVELRNSRLRISLPGLNIVECCGEGLTIKLQEPINIEADETKIWSQYPYFDLDETNGYQEIQTSFEMRGVMTFEKEIDSTAKSTSQTALIEGPLFHSKTVTKGSLKFSQFKHSAHYEDIGKSSKIAISVIKSSTLNRYIFVTKVI
jgi:hypothetical protein